MNVISPKKAIRVLDRYGSWIQTVSLRYHVPVAAIKSILYQEMVMINCLDVAADLVVLLRIPIKSDSSTGYGQIYGWVALNAANYAVDQGMATYESLGIKSDHRLDPSNKKDVRKIWRMLYRSPYANIEFATLNIVAAAAEVLGRTDFDNFSEDEMKLVFTRYNANVHHITPYGERAFRQYQRFEDQASSS